MNLCFTMGKIISNIEFEFILNSNHISISSFVLEINKNGREKVKAYNEKADWCYQKLVKGDFVAIQGSLDSTMEILLNDITLL